MVIELQQKTLGTSINLTLETTKLNKNILENINISIEAINNMNRNTNSNITSWTLYLELQKNLMQTFK